MPAGGGRREGKAGARFLHFAPARVWCPDWEKGGVWGQNCPVTHRLDPTALEALGSLDMLWVTGAGVERWLYPHLKESGALNPSCQKHLAASGLFWTGPGFSSLKYFSPAL